MSEISEKKGNPFRGIYVPEDVQDLLEIAFNRSKKSIPPTAKFRDPLSEKKAITLHRFEIFCRYLKDKLIELVKKYPSIDSIHPFYKSTLQIYASIDDVKRALAKLKASANLISRLERTYKVKFRSIEPRSSEREEVKKAFRILEKTKKEAYGRIASVIKKLKKELKLLAYTVKMLKKLPDIDPELPMVIVAGPPNTGKSSLVKSLSSAKVEVASYPFTTKNVTLGHLEIKTDSIDKIIIQVADTPGLFDRPIEKRKKEELLAIKALETIADVVIFLFDVSDQSVLTPEEQLEVLAQVLEVFRDKNKIILVGNKADIVDRGNLQRIKEGLKAKKLDGRSILLISVLKGEGLDLVTSRIKEKVFRGKK